MASSAVYSCVNILSQETSRLDIHHYTINEDRSRTLQISTSAARVMRNPNDYQTRSDFWLFIMQSLLLDGNAYAVIERDGNRAPKALHPWYPDTVTPHRVQDSNDLWYYLGNRGDMTDYAALDPTDWVPARDMMHLRLFPGADLIMGTSPLQALGPSVALGKSIQVQSTSFFQNMARPSGILRTPKQLNLQAAERLQKQWETNMSGGGAGGTPVLDNDVDWRPLTMSAVDAEVIAQYRLSVENIAQVYRIPMFMLGDMSKATFSNVESLQKAFIASALGFYLKHIENVLEKSWDMDVNQMMEFDLERGLLRPDLEQRMSAYSKGVLGGIYTPNEPRARENLPPVEGGDQIFLQRQNWPIDLLGADAETTTTEPAPEQTEEQTRNLRLIVNKQLEKKLA